MTVAREQREREKNKTLKPLQSMLDESLSAII